MYPNLKAEMARYGVSQGEIAELTGVTNRTVCSWLNGDSDMGVKKAFTIRDHFFPSMTIEYLCEELEVSGEPVG